MIPFGPTKSPNVTSTLPRSRSGKIARLKASNSFSNSSDWNLLKNLDLLGSSIWEIYSRGDLKKIAYPLIISWLFGSKSPITAQGELLQTHGRDSSNLGWKLLFKSFLWTLSSFRHTILPSLSKRWSLMVYLPSEISCGRSKTMLELLSFRGSNDDFATSVPSHVSSPLTRRSLVSGVFFQLKSPHTVPSHQHFVGDNHSIPQNVRGNSYVAACTREISSSDYEKEWYRNQSFPRWVCKIKWSEMQGMSHSGNRGHYSVMYLKTFCFGSFSLAT